MSTTTPTITKAQREALEEIRSFHVVIDPDLGITWHKTNITRYTKMKSGSADFNRGIVRRLVDLGFITEHSDGYRTRLRITNAGRVALGDWAAGEEA